LLRYRRITRATDAAVRRDLAALPAMLDRIDAWIDGGVIGAAEPNAADWQLASSIRLLMTMADLRRPIESRPAGALALRLVPEYPSRLGPGVLPIALTAPYSPRSGCRRPHVPDRKSTAFELGAAPM
jgi:glutathione S-transferase